jgi:hypothetical protein
LDPIHLETLPKCHNHTLWTSIGPKSAFTNSNWLIFGKMEPKHMVNFLQPSQTHVIQNIPSSVLLRTATLQEYYLHILWVILTLITTFTHLEWLILTNFTPGRILADFAMEMKCCILFDHNGPSSLGNTLKVLKSHSEDPNWSEKCIYTGQLVDF